jgi:2-polyprenyl-3-methyl-5-hydroxy-6-metoxy-1,4-benzoquinol methylase
MSAKSGSTFGDCAICGGSLVRELLAIKEPDRFERHLGVDGAGYRRLWVECEDCGAATNVYPAGVLKRLETLASGYYEVDFESSTIRQKFDMVMALSPDQSDNAQRVARVRNFLDRWRGASAQANPVALDIGAGTGVFLTRFLKEAQAAGQGWSAVAVEPDGIAAEHLRSLAQFEVKEAIFTEGIGMRDFDFCSMNKVLEHLSEPLILLHAAASALNPEWGVLYVEVPAKETVTYRPPTDNILGSLHRHLYDMASLNKAMEQAGLVVMEIVRLFEPSGKISVAAFAVKPEAAALRSRSAGIA